MKRYFNIFVALLLSLHLNAQISDKLELSDVFQMEYVSDPQISPDGTKVIYVRNFKDIMTDRNLSNLWVANIDGSDHRPLTTGNQNDFSPRWSHDGNRILFTSNMQDEKMKLFMMWMDTRQIVPLTNTPQSPRSPAWSPDDQYIAFNMFIPAESGSPIKLPSRPEGAKWNSPPVFIDDMYYRADGEGYIEGGNSHIFILSVNGGTPRQLTSGNKDYGSPVWSRDGRYLYFSSNLSDNFEFEPLNSEIHKLSVADGSIQPLTDRFGPDRTPVPSPDGKLIAFTGFDDTFQGYSVTKLYVINADGTGKRTLAEELDRDIEDIQWAGNGRGIYFQYTEKGDSKIGFVQLTGKVSTIVEGLGGLSLGRPYNAAAFSVSSNDRLAFTLGGPEHPADLATWDKGTTRRITNLNEDLFSFRKIGKVEEIWWKSSYDQREIQGWVVTPPDFDPSKKYPLILEIHGGPFQSYGSVFSAEIQLYAAAGYVVLYTNPRGSTGYGQEFGNLIHHDYPNHDYDDLMSGVDAVIEKGFIDSNNLFVTGGSGGGVLSAWIVGKTDRFKAAVVAKPVINWYSFVLYADGPGFFYQYWFDKKPWEDPESYLRRSPLSYVGNIKTPTMLLTGEQDFRTPIAESEQFYAALKIQKVETAMVRIPNASHGIASRPSNLIAKVAAVLYWFDKYRLQE